MLRLSVISDEVSQDLVTAAKFAKRYGLQGLEIRSAWGLEFLELVEQTKQIRTIIDEYDLKVSAIASPFFKAELLNQQEYALNLKILERSIEMAKALDCPIIRGFTFWRRGGFDEHLPVILEQFKYPVHLIEDHGMILGIENEPSTFATNAKKLATFLEALDSESVRAVWDPGNDIMDPDMEQPFPFGYECLKDKVVHVHLKDGVRKDHKSELLPIGDGEVNIEGQLKALLLDRYEGYVSLETHWRPKRLADEELVLPSGDRFSEMGEYASSICIQNLLRIISKLNG